MAIMLKTPTLLAIKAGVSFAKTVVLPKIMLGGLQALIFSTIPVLKNVVAQ